MSVWSEHVKIVQKKCPNLSFKEVLQEAKKTYSKTSKSAKPIKYCKTNSKNRRSKTTKKRFMPKGRKTMGKKRNTGKNKTKSVYKDLSKKFKCINYPRAKGC